jgi:hypothetical protein
MSRRRKARGAFVSAALALLLVALAPARAAAWGREGHVIVAHLARLMLTDKTRGVVKQLLPPNETVESVATWADGLRGSSSNPGPRPETSLWHFVDIPLNRGYDAAEDCLFLLNGPCVIDALYGVELVLADPRKGYYRNSRYEALKYAIHLTGDMHQPLHCSDDNDAGGNFKKVTWVGNVPTNLHAVWDEAILDANIAAAKKADPNFSKTGNDAIDYADFLFKKMTPAEKQGALPKSPQAATVPKAELIVWATEAHMLGQAAYKHLPAPPEPYNLKDGTYYQMHRADVDTQLRRGGVRLARLLNETLRQ